MIFERSGSVTTIGANRGRVKRVVKGVEPTWGRSSSTEVGHSSVPLSRTGSDADATT